MGGRIFLPPAQGELALSNPPSGLPMPHSSTKSRNWFQQSTTSTSLSRSINWGIRTALHSPLANLLLWGGGGIHPKKRHGGLRHIRFPTAPPPERFGTPLPCRKEYQRPSALRTLHACLLRANSTPTGDCSSTEGEGGRERPSHIS